MINDESAESVIAVVLYWMLYSVGPCSDRQGVADTLDMQQTMVSIYVIVTSLVARTAQRLNNSSYG